MKNIRSIVLIATVVAAGLIISNITNTNKAQSSEKNTGIKIGDKAPDIMLKNPADSVINLYSITGKLVLIDFWASWCGPCRFENPTVVAAYKKYKDEKFSKADSKGFTIFSVSLDKDKTSWKNAITKDGLIWPYHCSDLKFWYSPVASTYGVNSIPTNFLINKDGIVIAVNLRGAALAGKLEALK